MRTKTAKATKAEADVVHPSHLKGSTLPPDWEWVSLGNICRTTSGGTPSRKNKKYFEGDIPWVKSGELPDGPVSQVEEYITGEAVKNSSAKQFPKGTLLIALYGATVGKLGVLTKEAATNQAVCAIFPPDYLETKYLFWYLRFVRSDLVSQAIGGAQPNISQGIIRNLLIPVAPPLQQKRIVAEIEKQFSRLDEAVANLKRVKANLKRYKASVLKATVEGKLTEEWRKQHPNVEPAGKFLESILAERRAKWNGRGKYKETPVPDSTTLPPLPKTWTWSSVETVCSAVVDCPHSTPKWQASGRVCLRTTEFRPGRLDLSDVRYVSQATYESRIQRLTPRENDIVYSREGGILGLACMIPARLNPCLGQRMMLLRSHALFSPNLLMYWLNSPDLLARVRSLTGGSASPHLNVGEVKSFPVPVAPIAEQNAIAAEVERRLSVIDELEAAVQASLTRADHLRQAILQRAFSGRLLSEKGHAGFSDSYMPLLAAESVSPYGVRS